MPTVICSYPATIDFCCCFAISSFVIFAFFAAVSAPPNIFLNNANPAVNATSPIVIILTCGLSIINNWKAALSAARNPPALIAPVIRETAAPIPLKALITEVEAGPMALNPVIICLNNPAMINA